MKPITTVLEKSKHALGDITITEDHWKETGTRFYTVEFKASKKATKANPKLPVLLSVTDGTLANAKANFANQLKYRDPS